MSAADDQEKQNPPAAQDGFWHNGNFFAWAPPVTKPPPARIPSRLVVAAILHDPTKDVAPKSTPNAPKKDTVDAIAAPRPSAETAVVTAPAINQQQPQSINAYSQTTESKPGANTFVSHNGHIFAWAPPPVSKRQPDCGATFSQPTPEHSFSHNGHSYAWAVPSVTTRQPKCQTEAPAQSKPDTPTKAFRHNGHSFAWASSEPKRQSDSTTKAPVQAPLSLSTQLGETQKRMEELGESLERSRVHIERSQFHLERTRAGILESLAESSRAGTVQPDPLPFPLPRSSPPRSFKDFQDELIEARRLAVSSIARNQEIRNRLSNHGDLDNKLLAMTSRFLGERLHSQPNPQGHVAQGPISQQTPEPLPKNATIEPPKDLPSRYSFANKTDKPQDHVPSRYSFTADPVANPKSVVTGQGQKGHYRFSLLTDKLVRFEWSQDGGFEDRASTTAFFRSFPTPEFKVDDNKDKLEIMTKYFHLTYDKNEFSSSGLTVKVGTDVWRYDGKSYGDLGGTARTLDRADGRIPLEPGILSRKAYAVLDDSASMLFEDGWIATRKPGRKDGYLFAYHGDHKAAIKDFYRLSGGQPLLPRWALGNWWSRYHAYSDKEYLAVMRRFATEKIPLNVAVIDMDWHKVNIPAKYGSGWTGYSWNPDLFPMPENFLCNLHDMGLKVTVNDHPADGIRAFEDQYKIVAKALGQDTSKEEPIRFDCTDKKFLDVYFDILKANLEDEGIDFWWIDWQQGNRSRIPGVDPLWVLNHYHYLTSRRNVKATTTPITFSRYAGAGSHRYPIGFSGDTLITWASLHFQPEFTATASNIGYGWWSHDIGGHYAGVRSNELTARWVQFGCFSPILRLHSEKSQWNSKEPWLYEPEARKVMTNYLQLRYRLIPFLYTMNVRACYEFEPLVQPMYWNHKDEEAYTVPNQYYFGPDLMVAPITTPNDSATLMGSVRAWLPNTGRRYIDIRHPSLVYDGGRYVDIHRPLSEIPVFAKEGTIIPLDTAKSAKYDKHGSSRPQAITIQLVVGADAYFELVEEPSSSVPAAKADRPDPSTLVRTPIRWSQKEGVLTIGPEVNGRGQGRDWRVELLGCTKELDKKVADDNDDRPKFMGRPDVQKLDRFRERVRERFRDASYPNSSGLFSHGEQAQSLHSTIMYLGTHAFGGDIADKKREFSLGKDLQLDVVDIAARLHEMLYRCEMEYPMKEVIYNLVTRDGGPVKERVQRLWELERVPMSVKKAVLEIWGADGRSEGNAVEVMNEVVLQEKEVVVPKKDDMVKSEDEWDEDARSEQSYEFV
ncbi:glycosyl hydrolases family 31-domain-containing protein [Neurospora hispaniola]|uniref:alpha-glucosidase n=1 Tax=Neurospora hispaniola TaxID=588809 RepID=A0AAJ0MLM3_9PEZI|nr:glycosyl hydrolases family 31-domain-containing protein [Neurospora hispaniola]